MRIAASTSRTPFAHGNVPAAVDIEHTLSAGRWRIGRAYRMGRLVCGCVHVTINRHERLGLTQRERGVVRVRFHEPVENDLHSQLTQLLRRRGAAARRAVERVDPIEVVVDDPDGEPERIVGQLQPPSVRHGQLRDIEFELKRAQ